jgi:hypothetical protein
MNTMTRRKRRERSSVPSRPAEETDKWARWRRLGRDVGVNVVANLLAAAAIYLLAVAGGYLKANPTIIALIVVMIALPAAAAVSVYGFVLAARGGRWRAVGALLFLLMITAMSEIGRRLQPWLPF